MSPSPESLQERYAAIERVYAQQDWPGVESRSQALLAELPDEPRDPLRQRLLLLLAHTRLYGTGDPGGAAVLYQAVANAQPEQVLAEIAAQGLQQCAQLHPPAAATPATTTTPTAAMPWLQELGGAAPDPGSGQAPIATQAPFQQPAGAGQAPGGQPSVVEPVDVIEEPELIELALADPSRQELVTVEARSEEPPAPLRWPFMADHEDRRLPGNLPEGPSPRALEPASEDQRPELQPTAEDGGEGLTMAREPIAQDTLAEKRLAQAEEPLPRANLNQQSADVRPGHPTTPFSPEELAELSRGLLEVAIR